MILIFSKFSILIFLFTDAQNRLYEATENVAIMKINGDSLDIVEPRYHHFAHRYAPFMKRANVARRNKHKKHHKRRYGKNHNYGGGNNNINTKKRSNNFIKSSKPPLSSRSNAGDKKQLAGKFKNGNNLGQSTIDLNEIQSEGNELQIIANSDGPGFIST